MLSAIWVQISKMSDTLTPLSPTVAAIFDEFLKKLATNNTLSAEGIKALGEALGEQRLDPDSLRGAMFAAPKEQ
jgi:hypothetical protein